jgi:hypothetical protein
LLLFGVLLLGGVVVAGLTSGGGHGPSVGAVAIRGDSENEAALTQVRRPDGKELIPPDLVPDVNPARSRRESILEPPKPAELDLLRPLPERRDEAAQGDAASKLNQLGREARKSLREGTPNGSDAHGTPSGPPGPLSKGTNRIQVERVKRQLRWTMTFNTRDGSDYLHQLKALGAILAYEGLDGKYMIIRDLGKRPAKAEAAALPDRIYWIDDRPESVKSLAVALGIPTPKKFVAFFPENLEKELLRKELAYAGRSEQDIHETRFNIVPAPTGYTPRVVSQTPSR